MKWIALAGWMGVAAAMVAGCGGDATAPDAGTSPPGVDAGARLDGGEGVDAGAVLDGAAPLDAGAALDGAADVDAAEPIDGGDVPDAGGALDAGVTSCSTPGAVETVACGMCGTTTRFCTAARAWEYDVCAGEGVCAPGTTGTVPCGRCGTLAARCTTECVWDTGGAACTGEGLCAPGEVSRTDAGCPAGQSRPLTCNAACTFDAGACEIDECAPGTTTTAACGNCGARVRTCNASRRWEDGPCTGEGVCTPGTTGVGACGNCGTQPTRCNVACAYEPAAACSGEGLCAAGTTSACTTSCGTVGTQACSATCTPGVCVPPVESCNAIDDNCDGRIDEGCATCAPCAGSIDVTGTGGRYTVALGPNARSGSCGGTGSDALMTFTTTATSDVFVSTHGAGLDTVVYVRRCGCTGTELGCNNDADGARTSVLRLTALPAGTYTIVVDSNVAMSASIPVDVYVTPTASLGDRCGNPRTLLPGSTRITGNTCSASNDYDTPTTTMTTTGSCLTAAAGEGEDLVYYFRLGATSTVSFDGCNEGFSYDGTVYVRSICNSAVATDEVACDDDSCAAGTGTCTTRGFGPRTSVTLPAGMYYLFVDGYRSTSGTATCAGCGPFDLTITGI